MKIGMLMGGAALAFLIETPASAAPDLEVQPVQQAAEVIRYFKGVPTIELEMNDGIVRLTPLPLDHGSLAFAVAVYNDGQVPANFGIANVVPAFAGKPVQVFTRADLERKAKSRAFWSQFGIALLGATAATASASMRDTYSGTLVTPRGTYRSFYSVPSIYGQFQAAAISGVTVDAVGLVQYQLDRTLADLGDETVQLTTLEPGESYAGRIVLAKVPSGGLPQQLALTINWNGEVYPFAFQLARPGTPPPAYTLLPRKTRLTVYEPVSPDGAGRRRSGAEVVTAPSNAQSPTHPHAALATPAPAPTQAPHPATMRQEFGNARLRCVTCLN